jgi:hypothetical protein
MKSMREQKSKDSTTSPNANIPQLQFESFNSTRKVYLFLFSQTAAPTQCLVGQPFAV